MRRASLLALLLMGFAWPGHTERLVGDLTRAVTPRDKRDALRMLGTVAVPEEVVRPFLQDPDPGVRAEAERLLHSTLARGGTARLPHSTLARGGTARLLHSTLARGGTARFDVAPESADLITQLADESLEVRIAAARALAGRTDASSALLAYADAPLPELRAAVIDALARGPATPDVARLLARALEDPDSEVVLAALRGFARHRELALPAQVHTLAQGTLPQVARAASGLIAPRVWHDPLWLLALQRTTCEDPIEALEATLPKGESRAIAPLQAWLARAPTPLAPRIRALIARARGTR